MFITKIWSYFVEKIILESLFVMKYIYLNIKIEWIGSYWTCLIPFEYKNLNKCVIYLLVLIIDRQSVFSELSIVIFFR
jgi:hypothetical protein